MLSLRTYTDAVISTKRPSHRATGAYDRDDCPFKWSKQYKGIYRANLVLANIDNVPEKTGVDLNILKGETYFLRAYIYTEVAPWFRWRTHRRQSV